MPNITIDENQLKLQVEGSEPVTLNSVISETVNVHKGQVRFIHPFGDYIGHCEVEDCPQMKSMKADYYVLCNTFFLPLMLRYIKQTMPLIRTTTQIYSEAFNLDT